MFLPPISATKVNSESLENPFKLPPDSDLFMKQKANRLKRLEERQRNLKLPVRSKVTYSMQFRSAGISALKKVRKQLSQLGHVVHPAENVEINNYILNITKDMRVDKDILSDYIRKRREMFLLQYSIDVRLGEIRRLKDVSSVKEQQLNMEEKFLEDSAIMFEKFLKENDKLSSDAVKAADNQTRAKLEKISEIKATNAKILQIKSDLNKQEDRLREDLLFKKFLVVVAPEEWQEKRQLLVNINKAAKAQIAKTDKKGKDIGIDLSHKRSTTSSQQDIKVRSADSSDIGLIIQPLVTDNSTLVELLEEDDEECPIFFTIPQQLLDILAELEEEALNLIHHSQDTEEALEEMNQQKMVAENRINKEISFLQTQIEIIKTTIAREEEKTNELQLKAKMFSFGEFNSLEQELDLHELTKKIEICYRRCIGDYETNITAIQMLTNIEHRINEILEDVEYLPKEKIEFAKRLKEKERRQKANAEKMKLQKLMQEERLKKSMERATAAVKRLSGRKLMFRSQPPKAKQKDQQTCDKYDKDQAEYAYFFT